MKTIVGRHTYNHKKIVCCGSSDQPHQLIIGKYCSFGSDIKIFVSDSHNVDVISTFPFFHPNIPITSLIPSQCIGLDEKQHYSTFRDPNTVIGNDVWVADSVVIFKGVRIGDGAVIGAFSKVTKNIPPYSIVVGDSRIVRKRFSDEDIEFLLKLKWWNLPDEEVASIAAILHNPDIEILKKWAKDNGKI